MIAASIHNEEDTSQISQNQSIVTESPSMQENHSMSFIRMNITEASTQTTTIATAEIINSEVKTEKSKEGITILTQTDMLEQSTIETQTDDLPTVKPIERITIET